MSSPIPLRSTVLVIGGGPAGSYCSTLLAREGIEVVLLEAVKHPREHVGETMLPSMRNFLKHIDLEDEYSKQGYVHKPGACFKLDPDGETSFIDLRILGPGHSTWNVKRAHADELMLRYAARQGVKVFEETRVESIEFSNPADVGSRPVAANWSSKSGHTGRIAFDWLVDASGRQGIMSAKYLKNRIYREGLRNVAAYGYWKGVSIMDPGGIRENAPLFECLSDHRGWCWVIPLSDGIHSIGVVQHEDTVLQKKKEGPSALEDHYLAQVKLAAGAQELIGETGKFMQGSAKQTVDYSYHARSYSGDHYRIIGDAAAFVDPLFSSGVHAALTTGLSAALTILGSMKKQVDEADAQAWHDAKVGICQARFLMVVLSAYKHMQHQDVEAVLPDGERPNFNEAFGVFRHVISGQAGDHVPSELTNDDFYRMIDFTRNLFTHTTEDQFKAAQGRVGPQLLAITGEIKTEKEVRHALDDEDGDTLAVFKRMNSLKILRNDTGPEAFSRDILGGYKAVVERGKMGLARA